MEIVTAEAKTVPATSTAEQVADRERISWREEMRRAIRTSSQLLAAVGLAADQDAVSDSASAQFPVFAPWPFVRRMRYGHADDPLLRQVLPVADELRPAIGFSNDPVGDEAGRLMPGLLHKYSSRALLITTGACAIHCRYCFRRHFPYSEAPKSPDDWQPAIDRIAADPSVDEAILSGGDPLTLVDEHLAELTGRLARVKHLRRLRIHTRLPIMIPQRVTSDLIDWVRGTRLAGIFVLHANHGQEIDDEVADALARLSDTGIPLLNQSVLLRGVNDSPEALIDLSRRLVDLRVMPYYLHQLDKVAGAAHFEVPIERGMQLVDHMRRALPGYAVPRYVQEIAGEKHKRVLA